MIVSAGYRIGPFEVESALVAHPAVAEAAAVAAPDEERGAVVRAVVVLRDGARPSPELARELQEHVKRETAPYKYPRIVDFARELPKTASGKVKRAQLRRELGRAARSSASSACADREAAHARPRCRRRMRPAGHADAAWPPISDDDRVDLDLGALRQRGHADRHARRRLSPAKNDPYTSLTAANAARSVM